MVHRTHFSGSICIPKISFIHDINKTYDGRRLFSSRVKLVRVVVPAKNARRLVLLLQSCCVWVLLRLRYRCVTWRCCISLLVLAATFMFLHYSFVFHADLCTFLVTAVAMVHGARTVPILPIVARGASTSL